MTLQDIQDIQKRFMSTYWSDDSSSSGIYSMGILKDGNGEYYFQVRVRAAYHAAGIPSSFENVPVKVVVLDD